MSHPPIAPKVETERAGSTLIVRINRPEVRNAIDRETSELLAGAFDLLDNDRALSAGVLTCAGSHFCAGMDLKAFARGELPTSPRGFGGIVASPPAKPVIAAIEGYAVGGGFEIALACDLLVAGAGAVFALPEVKRGLTAAGGALFRLPRRIPYFVAMELALTGISLTADRAFSLGLLNRLVPDGEAMSCAIELAAEISLNGPLAVAASKLVMSESPDWPLPESFDRQEAILGPVRLSSDAREGAMAFAEKRLPEWRGV